MSRTDLDRYQAIHEKIVRCHTTNTPYPPELKERLNRWKAARTYLLDPKPQTDFDVVEALMQDFDVSEGTAWNDVRDTKRYFATMEQVNLDFEKIRLKQRIEHLEGTTNKETVKAQCQKNLITLGGFDQPQPQETGSRQIIFNIDFNPSLLGVKPIPNLLGTVEKFIGEKAKKELLIEDIDFQMIDAGSTR